MQVPILTILKSSDAILNRDRLRDLFISGHREAFKHEFIFLSLISLV
jgi:hypothetical protein